MNMLISMLKENHLPNEYWGEIVECVVYILNMCPTKSVINCIHLESWSGKNCSVSHFKIFGCVAYAHVHEEIRNKLDDQSENCIFIGYNDVSKAYCLYDPITKKLIINKDVEFKEKEAWD